MVSAVAAAAAASGGDGLSLLGASSAVLSSLIVLWPDFPIAPALRQKSSLRSLRLRWPLKKFL